MKHQAVRMPVYLMLSLIIIFASGMTGAVSYAEEVTITLTPHNPPVQIQPSGGIFDYNIDTFNSGDSSSTFDVWTTALLPNGNEVGPLSGPFRIMLPSGWSAYRDLSQNVPENAPAGEYVFSAHVGIFPSDIRNSDSFTFEKLAESSAWFEQTSGTSAFLSGIYFTDNMNGWAVGSVNTIMHTDDGGNNWYQQSPPPSTNYSDVYFTDSMTGWAVGSSGKIVHTTDGGNIWNNQESGTSNGLSGVHFVDSSNGWIAGGKARSFTPPSRFILHTTDGGQTWERQFYESDRDPLQDIFFIDPMNGWAVGNAGAVLHTSDAGMTWTEQNSGTLSVLYSVHFTDNLSGWAVGAGGTAIQTTDGGNTWMARDLGTGESLSDVYFVNAMNGWVTGGNTSGMILHTDDGGNTWHPQDPGTEEYLSSIFFIDENTGWAAGNTGTILHTITGGE